MAPVPELLTQLCPSASEACADSEGSSGWCGSGPDHLGGQRQARQAAGTWWHIVAHSGIGEGHFQPKTGHLWPIDSYSPFRLSFRG